jgi:arsenate reductase (thioredoxin)
LQEKKAGASVISRFYSFAMDKPLILILCTGNSCRSQMAEAILSREASGIVCVESAGLNPAKHVHPKAIQVMNEIGIDISQNCPKRLNEFLNRAVHTVITVCGSADKACPIFPGIVRRYHWGFEDPAKAQGTEDEVLAVFRRVRDEIAIVFGAYGAGIKFAEKKSP